MTKRVSLIRILLAVGVALVLAAGLSPGLPPASAAEALPAVLPALRQWQAGAGAGYAWTAAARVVVNPADAATLTAAARTFAADLGLALNVPSPPVVTATVGTTQPGDIFLGLGSTDQQLGNEGYALTVGPTLQVSAQTVAGAFWGSRTILQLVRQSTALPAGTVRDWPQYAVRAVLVDTNARHFPLGWWFNEIRDLSYLKLNELQFGANTSALSAAESQQIDAFAATYNVKLTPVVNMPGHLNPGRCPAAGPRHAAQRQWNRAAGGVGLGESGRGELGARPDVDVPGEVRWIDLAHRRRRISGI
ncbi:glycoside hydrolase family 20 zincin-like fold domain-containing protein [Fodinicola feengrottensis]|uniref:glycoside hydrolase family 20 zincin-like fold domain-containing protein n=1 Tax=Fodinicola feengrottensis TaxID=435914 RepID=UPI0013D43829|nr:glycoside hydrolase family 20 zincin-like fold domain-containing protein [Fodinicola feengrottensis]